MAFTEELPPELQAFASLLDAQQSPVREIFAYCLCLMMVEAGKMRLLETKPGETAPLYVFTTVAGDTFAVPRPAMSPGQEADVIAMLREILKDEGLL
ncbi:MAG: hypothetical protein L0332_13675 [Chloroflexi bacterium]|nr:hypothetical protein [Chloroflexota bacterium]MCI0645572.1 hypothetical protein [Chloroflexota bacterium]MCI0727753.1 hypothetical protein [Chloroflexota bacterium]